MKKITLILCTSFVLLFGQMSLAQVEKGDINLGFNANLSTITGLDTDNASGTLIFSYQKYVSDNISLGMAPLYMWNTSDDSFSSIFGMNVFLNYSILTSGGKTLPYLGAQYSALFLYSESGEGLGFSYFETRSGSVGGNAGVKVFLNEYANLDFNLSYTTIIATSVDSGNGFEEVDAEGGILQFTIGIGVIIGKK